MAGLSYYIFNVWPIVLYIGKQSDMWNLCDFAPSKWSRFYVKSWSSVNYDQKSTVDICCQMCFMVWPIQISNPSVLAFSRMKLHKECDLWHKSKVTLLRPSSSTSGGQTWPGRLQTGSWRRQADHPTSIPKSRQPKSGRTSRRPGLSLFGGRTGYSFPNASSSSIRPSTCFEFPFPDFEASIEGVRRSSMGSRTKKSRRTDDNDSVSEWENSIDSEMEEETEYEQNEGHEVAEMEELEKEYSNLRQQEQDLLRNLKRHKDEDLLKGQAVKNQKVLWDKSLELRFLLQKCFSGSNKLPQEPLRSSLCTSGEAVSQAYSGLISSSEETLNCLLELQEALLEKNPFITQVTNELRKDEDGSDNVDGESDQAWLQIHKMHHRIAPFRNSSIDKWQRKTQVTIGAAAFKGRLHAFNQNISEQVATYMRDPSRMVKRMQLHRSAIRIFGEVPVESGSINEKDVNVDGDPELLDDSEFYQQLLKEFFESCDPASSETAYYALKKQQTKKRKVVDRRASKSRKIRYDVHEKIVNFMAPEPMNLPPMATELFKNLFGQQNQKLDSIAA